MWQLPVLKNMLKYVLLLILPLMAGSALEIVGAEAQVFGNPQRAKEEQPQTVEAPIQPLSGRRAAPSGDNANAVAGTNENQPQSGQNLAPAQGLQPPVAIQEPLVEENRPEPQAAYQVRFVNGTVELEDDPKILLYYRDFKISRNMNGSVNCTMRFYVLSTIKEKISNISYRLKWPKIETALSFDDIQPNVATYFDYSLLGNGCYSMDKAPNIIVNRCRVKGMTQRQCADAIEWLE